MQFMHDVTVTDARRTFYSVELPCRRRLWAVRTVRPWFWLTHGSSRSLSLVRLDGPANHTIILEPHHYQQQRQ